MTKYKRDKTYIPKEYWQKKSSIWSPKKAIVELNNLRLWMSEFCPDKPQILEIGSGTGRVYSNLHKNNIVDDTHYKMCDIVDGLIKRCEKNTGIKPDKWDGIKTKYKDDQFDLLISFSVLMWVPPENIDKSFKEHVRICKKHIFIATWYADLKGIVGTSGRVFEHNYFKIFKKYNLKVVKEHKINSDDIYLSRRNWLLEKQ